jgi:[ribosomal protein S5]-alanine N-acetyltransferase
MTGSLDPLPGSMSLAAGDLPVLDAGPFLVRGFAPGDVGMVVEASADEVIPLVASLPANVDEAGAMAFVERQGTLAAERSGYSFVIAERHSDWGVGSIGLWTGDLDAGRASIGYWVLARARRRGAAGHALRAVASWAFDHLGLARLEVYVEPWNTPSVRTAEAGGFTCEGLLRQWEEVDGERRDMALYSLLATDRS